MNVVTQFSAARDYDHDLRFSAMFEAAAIGIGICQLDGRILEANPALAKMLGYSREELAGAHAHEFYPEFRPEFSRGPSDANSVQEERLLGELLRSERASFEIEKRCQRKDGSAFWGHFTVSLARDTRRQPAYLVAMLADASERKRMEEHLREAEKMEVIGRLAGGIAHDFNNLLTGILLYCDLLSAGLADSAVGSAGLSQHGLSQHIDEIRMAGEQGAALTQQLLAIARKQAAEPRPLLINEIVASMEGLLRRLIGEPIELVTTLDPRAGPVLADLSQFRQVVLNLVLNARDALPHGGKIRVITRAAEFPDLSKPANSEPGNPKPSVSLAVKDNGCGMNEETRGRLFEPFFTTKNPGEGTGLGLATVQRIVSEAGGVIQLQSEQGRGTCIEVFFPAIEPAREFSHEVSRERPLQYANAQVAQPLAAGSVRATSVRATSMTILLVDDHAPARKSMQRILLDTGYRILPASSGKQALRLFAEYSSVVDLLIADYVMPGMNGKELADTLRRQKPDLKVLLVSGYHHTPLDPAVGASELIRKPFSGKALIERVGEVMHSP